MHDDALPAAADLDAALSAMRYELEPGRFALAGFPEPPTSADLVLLEGAPGQLTREGGETTLLVAEARLDALRRRRPHARVEDGLVWIRFVAPMSWEVVGFLAKVTGSLAAAGVPLGAVCGFSRDHLFVHERYLAQTREVLDALFPDAPRP